MPFQLLQRRQRCYRGAVGSVGLVALLVGTAPAQPSYDLAVDAARKAAMTADELAWETRLEENLGDFYLPRYKVDKLAGRTTASDYVKDDPKLPRVLLIGDSISRGYTVPVREALAGKANVHRAPANCGSTTKGIQKLDTWLGDGHWDVIHFNFGIHDRNLPPETYAANLEDIIASLQKTGATLIWARTTPPATGNNAERFSPAQCESVNRVADGIMKEHGIALNDLCTPVESRLADLQVRNNVHFNAEGYDFLGQKVAAAILVTLNQTPL